MFNANMKEIEIEQELKEVLEMCYNILGTGNTELYGYDACHEDYRKQGIMNSNISKDFLIHGRVCLCKFSNRGKFAHRFFIVQLKLK